MKNLQIIFILVLVFSLNLTAQDETTLVEVGDKAPAFTIEMQDGTTKQLSDLKGKVVWINFFATWCPPCRKELPYLEKEVFNKLQGNPGFELLVIGREHTWKEVNAFKNENKYQLPFYPDPERKVFSKYASQNIPRNFIIDHEGNVAVASTGFKMEEFKKIILKVESLLEKQVNP